MHKASRNAVATSIGVRLALALGMVVHLTQSAAAADWPTFNHDNARTGATTESITAERLRLAWTWHSASPPQSAWPGPAKWDAFANIRDLSSMRNYDPVFHPVVVGDAVYFCSSADDSVYCLEVRTGKIRWTYTADGPVRIAPAVADGRVYFSSDDGAAYCVSAADGKLVWRFNPRPPQRLILNDGRLISTMPVRTGVLVDGGTAYFAAALLPWEPAVLCAVDAATGKPEGAGRYVREFESLTTFEGPLICSQTKLIAPQGRVAPLLFDRATGNLLGPLDGAGGGCFVLLTPQDQVIHGPGNKGGQLVATRTNDRTRAAVIQQGRSMAVSADIACVVKPLSIHTTDAQFKAQRWQIPGQYAAAIIAGDTIFLGGADEVVAVAGKDGRQLWRAAVEGKAYGLAVAAGSLFVSTDAGVLYCFEPKAAQGTGGDKPAAPASVIRQERSLQRDLILPSGPTVQYVDLKTAVISWETDQDVPTVLDLTLHDEVRRLADSTPKRKHEIRLTDLKRNRIYRYTIRNATDAAAGLASTFELDTEFNFAMASSDARKNPFASEPQQPLFAAAAERILAQSGVQNGICLVIGTAKGQLPYELAARSQMRIIALCRDEAQLTAARKALLPTGLYGSQIAVHQYDKLDELPLPGMIANLVVSEQAITGDQPGSTAAEVFRLLRPHGGVAYLGQPAGASTPITGAALKSFWQTAQKSAEVRSDAAGVWSKTARGELPGAGQWTHQYGRADNSAFGGEKLGGSANSGEFMTQWVGRPGPGFQPDRSGRMPGPLAAEGRLFVQGLDRILAMDSYNGSILWSREVPGMIRMNVPRDSSNWCTDGDFIYLAVRGECWQMETQTGQIVRKLAALPGSKPDWKYDWSYIGSVGPLLFGTSVKQGSAYTDFWGGSNWYDAPQGPETFKVCSDNLYAIDKQSGTTKWEYTGGLILNTTITIGPKAVYLIECRHPKVLAADTRRVGAPELWQQQFMVALDPASGKKIWERAIDTHDGVTVFYLAQGDGKLALVSSGAGAYHVYVFGDENGSPIWDHRFNWPGGAGDHGKAMSRPAIVGKKLFVRPLAFDLDTGKVLPQSIPGGGCGTYACAEGSLIFRSGHVTMWDANSGDLSHWQRLRPGCWLSTIPADGLILSPEAGGGCSCGQWLETSIAFVPRTYYPTPRIVAEGEVFSGSVDIELHSVDPNGVIRYTLDGSEPTVASAAYEKTLRLDRPATIKAKFYHHDGNHGFVATRSFRPGFGDVKNLAPEAVATASSEFNATYAAKMATNGVVPPKMAGGDAGNAWAVFGPKAGGKAEFVLTWKEPVEIGEIIYFGRTGFTLDDCFKDVEVYLNDESKPVLQTQLQKVHGAQRIAIPPTQAKSIRLKFTSSHGGGNPGASEIMVFSKTPADTLLPK